MALDLLAPERANLLGENASAYYMGAQGPDPFLYLRISVFRFLRACPYGGSLHIVDTGRFFSSLLEFAQGDPVKTAYVCGYLVHYALDCAAHPYVYARSCESCHTRFEVQLDMAMLMENGVDPSTVPAVRLLPPDPRTDRKIDELMSDALSQWAGLRAKNVFKIAIRKMRFGIRLTYDPKRKKHDLLEKLGCKQLAGYLFLPDPGECGDILNLSHSSYAPPWDAERTLALSFPEMLDAASHDAARYIDAVLDALLNSGSIKDALAVLGSRSFDTGLEGEPRAATATRECCFKDGCCGVRAGDKAGGVAK